MFLDITETSLNLIVCRNSIVYDQTVIFYTEFSFLTRTSTGTIDSRRTEWRDDYN